jgi:GxxExxY protein
LLHREVTEKIIGAAFEVYGELGYGFLERVYERALQVELLHRGLRAEIEKRTQVKYKKVVVGDYDADLAVAGVVLVELKVNPQYDRRDEAQRLESNRHQSGPARQLRKNEGRVQAPHLLNPCLIRVHPWQE